jgi:hypothetical protein
MVSVGVGHARAVGVIAVLRHRAANGCLRQTVFVTVGKRVAPAMTFTVWPRDSQLEMTMLLSPSLSR